MADDLIEAIRAELRRLHANASNVGPVDAIYVEGRGGGVAALVGSLHAPGFLFVDTAEKILARLRKLPDDAGPQRVRSEFHAGR